MSRIDQIHARQVFDSRGNPTIEVDLVDDRGHRGRACVPAGASTGTYEAHELRDGDPARFQGRGVMRAVCNVHEVITPALRGRPLDDLRAVDQSLIDLDGSPHKSRLGANALLAVSLAACHATAALRKIPLFQYFSELSGRHCLLPLPMVNMISGGLHAGGKIEFQDFLAIPLGASSFTQALHWIVKLYHNLGQLLGERGYEAALIGDEGGYGPALHRNEQAVELVLQAIERSGFQPGREMALALDLASTHFWRDGLYCLDAEQLSSGELVDQLADWVNRYPIVSIEDGCAEEDWDGWKLLSERLGQRVQLVGDDLFVTNPQRLADGVAQGVANAILIKMNQIGTITETLDVMRQAWEAGYSTVVSARSGETEDSSIVHLAVGTASGQIKIGSVARSERLAKYNELLRIEELLGNEGKFAGRAGLVGD